MSPVSAGFLPGLCFTVKPAEASPSVKTAVSVWLPSERPYRQAAFRSITTLPFLAA